MDLNDLLGDSGRYGVGHRTYMFNHTSVETNVLNEWPKTSIRSMLTHICITMAQSPKCQAVWLYDLPLYSYRPLRDKYHKLINGPKMALNITRSKEPHIYVLLESRSPKFHSVSRFDHATIFTLLHATLRPVQRMTPKWSWTLQGQRYPSNVNVLLLSPCRKYQAMFYSKAISSYRLRWYKYVVWSQNDPEHYKVKGTSYILLELLSPKFSPRLSTSRHVQDICDLLFSHWPKYKHQFFF